MVQSSAPGKIILSGEHAVVYGFPALVTAIDRRLKITVDKGLTPTTPHSEFLDRLTNRLHELIHESQDLYIQNISSRIPVGSGLGSSAALATAASAAFYYSLHNETNLPAINDLAYELEKLQHKFPSGVDNTICTYGGFIWYVKQNEQQKTFTPTIPVKKLPPLLLIHSGTPKETTGEVVQMVRDSLTRHPEKISSLLSQISLITDEFRQFLSGSSSTPLPQLITANERLLEQLGVVSPSTQELIQQIESLGGAAKVSGAGGITAGSGILIAYHPDLHLLRQFAKTHHLRVFTVKLGAPGVQL